MGNFAGACCRYRSISVELADGEKQTVFFVVIRQWLLQKENPNYPI
nr:hypothetical protein [Alkalicoccus halolimnae]